MVDPAQKPAIIDTFSKQRLFCYLIILISPLLNGVIMSKTETPSTNSTNAGDRLLNALTRLEQSIATFEKKQADLKSTSEGQIKNLQTELASLQQNHANLNDVTTKVADRLEGSLDKLRRIVGE
jgi:conjugal transfer/entry exclusion protein